MAKASGSAVAVQDTATANVGELAKALFVANWRPRSGMAAWSLAVDSYKAAAEFISVAEQIETGSTPADVVAAIERSEVTAESQNTGGKEQ